MAAISSWRRAQEGPSTLSWLKFIFTVGAIVAIAVVYGFGRNYDKQRAELLVSELEVAAPVSETGDAIVVIPDGLPPPVERYLSRVLPKKSRPIHAVWMEQAGTLRTGTKSDKWMDFTARQFIATVVPGFVWDARVALPLGAHLRVLDSYVSGQGGGSVSLLSAIRISAASNEPELNSGALHRYLAESVWYPTALLPRQGFSWAAKDDRAAVATLTDHGIEVSLEFRFNDADEVIAIYSPGRYGRFDGEYRKAGWEGHFGDYRESGGYRIPRRGEVGWYDEGTLQLVWKGEIRSIRFQQDR